MKRLYHVLSLLALVYFFATAGFIGFLFGTGRLDAERIDRMAAALRGEALKPAAAASQPASQPAPVALSSRAEIARMQEQRESLELLGERARREIEQRQALDRQIQLEVTRQIEEIQARRNELQENKKKSSGRQQVAQSNGLEREVELLSSVEPKNARDLLMQRKEPDAVQVLMRMETNRVKKIVDACKTDGEKAWIGRILNQIHNMDTAVANGVDGPDASSR
jgi:hypothetical protein